MRDFIDFSLLILKKMVGCWFGLDLGNYSFGDFLVAVLVVSVFIGSLVISFRRANSAGSVTRPMRHKGSGGAGGQNHSD